MTVPRHICAQGVERPKIVDAFIANLVAIRVDPGIAQRIGSGLHLLVRDVVDGRVCVIVVGTRAEIARETGLVRYHSVERIRPKHAMIGTVAVARTF